MPQVWPRAVPTCSLSKASQGMEAIRASFTSSGPEAKLNSHPIVGPCLWPARTPFSFNPKGTLKACLLSSDAQCPCQLINQEQEPWPCKVSKALCTWVLRAQVGWQLTVYPSGSKPTSADGPVPHIAWFAGAAVSSDSVGADGILITVVLPTATFIVLCTQREKRKRDTFI